jgi:hypothetical protein
MEDDLKKKKKNGRRPQKNENGRRPKFLKTRMKTSTKWKTTLKKWKTT